MLTSIIGYILTAVFGTFAALFFGFMWTYDKDRAFGAFVLFILMSLLALGTAYVAGL